VGRQDSNQRPIDYQTIALTTELRPKRDGSILTSECVDRGTNTTRAVRLQISDSPFAIELFLY
jgi:hypothetical protein